MEVKIGKSDEFWPKKHFCCRLGVKFLKIKKYILGNVLSVLFLSAKILSELLIKLTNLYGYPNLLEYPN